MKEHGILSEMMQDREKALAEQAQKYADKASTLEMFAANVPGGYHRCGVGEGFPLEFVSDSFLRIVGWTKEELEKELDNKVLNLVAPEDTDFFMAHEPALVQDGKVDLVYRIRRKDGTRRWVQDSTLRVEIDGKQFYQCILADITDFVQRQDELARQNMELLQKELLSKTLVENMPSGYHRCKAEEGCPILFVGQHFTDIVGYTREEIQREFGNLYHNMVWEEDISVMETFTNMLNMRGKGNAYETSVYRMKHKDGGYRWVTDSTMFVDLGEESFFQSTISDITEYVENLNEARKRAEESNQAKSTFLFNASHDIRTPMNAIQGFARIIEDNAEDPQIVRETIRKIRQAGDTLMTLMNDVLELSRIERGKDEVNEQPLNMEEHANKLYEMFYAEMTQAGIQFSMQNDITHPNVLGDDLKLTRIAMNLLSNARKFTPAGGSVTFGVLEENCDGEKADYRFCVRDTGIGMSQEFQAHAFEQFERERSATDSGVSGSGLGLAITKRLVELMGGTCTIESELGKGSEITVQVPLTLTRQEKLFGEDPVRSVDFSGKRVLLVEDNDFNREIARYVLEGLGFAVEEAENGSVCVDKLFRAEHGSVDLILMDIQMPIMDGYVATKEIRNIQDPRLASTPIVAMTANAFEEDKQKCLDVGMNGHIGKPIDPTVLVRTLAQVLQE